MVVLVLVLVKVEYEVIQNLQLPPHDLQQNPKVRASSLSLKLPADPTMTSESRVFCWVPDQQPDLGPSAVGTECKMDSKLRRFC